MSMEQRAQEAWDRLTPTQQMAIVVRMERMTRRVEILPQEHPPEYAIVPET